MGWLEEKLLNDWSGVQPYFWKRYIDDIIFWWRSDEEELLKFLTFLNSSHPTIKFTGEWRMNGIETKVSWDKENSVLKVVKKPLEEGVHDRSVDFLDTTIWFDENNIVQTDLFVKDCAKVSYLLPSSCHPGHITQNIPYSLGYRLKRICSVPQDYTKRVSELKENLLSRNYSEKVIDNAFTRLDLISREEALKKVVKPENKSPVFAITYDSRLKSVPQIMTKHFKVASENWKFQKTFKNKPIVAYRRQKTIGDYLVSAKLHPPQRSGAQTRGQQPGLKNAIDSTGGVKCAITLIHQKSINQLYLVKNFQ